MRLIIVSNRLPVTVTVKNQKIVLNRSAGGVATGLMTFLGALKNQSAFDDYLWIGWPGSLKGKKLRASAKKKLAAKKLQPVFLSNQDVDNFYNGFCNDTIWPLFHYLPTYVSYSKENWESYKEVNEKYCEAIAEVARPGDVIWIHDYQLMLLPKMLRDRLGENMMIGFFLHIPFPVFEVFRLLPEKWRRGILNGMLGADLIGFHTYDYTQYFTGSVQRLLGFDHNMGYINLNNRKVVVDTFPMGIDFSKYFNAGLMPKVKIEMKKYKKTIHGRKIILSIDRLDYTKGILKRLEGFEMFLQQHSQWLEKVILVIVVSPSRVDIERYQEMKSQIDEMVGKINGRFGNINWSPILYQFKTMNFKELLALYNLSDVALVTPLRDGMNLIAKEYVASHRDKNGVLILSEMAGTSQELGEAISINPNHIEEIAEALEEALEMDPSERRKKMEIMQSRLKTYNIFRWAKDFTNDLIDFKARQKEERDSRFLSKTIRSQMIRKFKKAKKRLLLLDYDGTLVPFYSLPAQAKPDASLLNILGKLSSLPRTSTVIISGRDKSTLDQWFGSLKLIKVAEHGVWVSKINKAWEMIKPLRNDWREAVLPILETYVDRVPGSFIEKKDFSVVWHFRAANPELARKRSKELTTNLMNFTSNLDVQIMQGNKVVEIRSAGVDKGSTALSFIKNQKHDFILAIGDDSTDEDLFKALPEDAYTVKVGSTQTAARFSLDSYAEVLKLLNQLARKP